MRSVYFEANPKLENIPPHAFWNTQVQSIAVPASVIVISAESFTGRREEQVWMDVWEERPRSYIQKIVFQRSCKLERIEDGAFKRASLNYLVIPSSVRYLGAECFWNSGCCSLIFEETSHLEEIGAQAFEETGIVSLSIPASVRVLGSRCFSTCWSLRFVKFDRMCRLEQIGHGAFKYSSLTWLVLPSALPSIDGSFAGCTSDSVVIDGDNCPYRVTDLLLLDIPGSMLYRFFGRARSIMIAASVSVMGDSCFDQCHKFDRVVFESNSRLTRIGTNAFCFTTIQTIAIPASVTVICERAFESSRIESISFEAGSKLERIERQAFANCSFSCIVIPSACVLEPGCFYECFALRSVRQENGERLSGSELRALLGRL
jgi:hypothetical protein